jgi:hypothetical protein
MMHEDMLLRPIEVGQYVVYYSNIYQVIELLGASKGRSARLGTGLVRIKLIDASKTTKSVKKNSHEMCIIDTDDVLIWKLKRGF